MEQYWDEATFLLLVLELKCTKQDENGIDLTFTVGGGAVSNHKPGTKWSGLVGKISGSGTPFEKAMETAKPQPKNERKTNMSQALKRLFTSYIEENRTRTKKKKLTLIVLTDGKWEGENGSQNSVKACIIDIYNELKKKELIGSLDERFVSIEFVQLGQDIEAMERFRDLDNNLVHEGIE